MSHQARAPESRMTAHSYKASLDSIASSHSTTGEDPHDTGFSSSSPFTSAACETDVPFSSLTLQTSPMRPLNTGNTFHQSTPPEPDMSSISQRLQSQQYLRSRLAFGHHSALEGRICCNHAQSTPTPQSRHPESINGLVMFNNQMSATERNGSQMTSHPSTAGNSTAVSQRPQEEFHILDRESNLPPSSTAHTVFTRITTHTAKCDRCEQHNLRGIYRCRNCSIQICEICRNKSGLKHDIPRIHHIERFQGSHAQQLQQHPQNTQGLAPFFQRHAHFLRPSGELQRFIMSQRQRRRANARGIIKNGCRGFYPAREPRRSQLYGSPQYLCANPGCSYSGQTSTHQFCRNDQNASPFMTCASQAEVPCAQCSMRAHVPFSESIGNADCHVCRSSSESNYIDMQLRLLKEFLLQNPSAVNLLDAFRGFLMNIRARDSSMLTVNGPQSSDRSHYPDNAFRPNVQTFDMPSRNWHSKTYASSAHDSQRIMSFPSLPAGSGNSQLHDAKGRSDALSDSNGNNNNNNNKPINATSSKNSNNSSYTTTNGNNEPRLSQGCDNFCRERQEHHEHTLPLAPNLWTFANTGRNAGPLRRAVYHCRRGSV